MNKCSCGRPLEYYDALCCNRCWDKQKAWDSSAPGNGPTAPDNFKCQCGNPKYYDASSCEECYEKARPYFDSRDG